MDADYPDGSTNHTLLKSAVAGRPTTIVSGSSSMVHAPTEHSCLVMIVT
ncbi:hypothetical protein RvY_18875 [Ramazzottius varieornatus]|uniref:Uncharacterized protein n=1 Tax=Ramazzottius varieornatus TaxID=947166 RepID=A0A1D1W7C7_RAMVA|nr:hypothetical protein RvY_18875 [Ramazzottius varieornatus]